MVCCKAKQFGWCKDYDVVYVNSSGEGYCLFHAPKAHKGIDRYKFENGICDVINSAKIEKKICNLSGTIFPWDINFENYDKNNPFPESIFIETEFYGTVKFNNVYFENDLTFDNSKIHDKFFCTTSVFNGDARFDNVTFEDDAYFSGTLFSCTAWFSNSKFKKLTSFSHVIFNHETWIDSIVFFGNVNFQHVNANNTISFHSTKFYSNSTFNNSTFNQVTLFSETYFSGNAHFETTIFCEEVNFSNAVFNGKALFNKSKFQGLANFIEVKFREFCNFESTTFFADTRIEDTVFFKNTLFHKAKFNSFALIHSSVFKKNVSFYESVISNGSFLLTRFEGQAIFHETVFTDQSYFTNTEFLGKAAFVGTFFSTVDFDGCLSDKTILIDRCDLSQFYFKSINAEQFHFRSCCWQEINKRRIIADELKAIELDKAGTNNSHSAHSTRWRRLEEMYRQLKCNAKLDHNETLAGDWHFREKEALYRGIRLTTSPFLKCFLFLYRWSSGYGEDAIRALATLAGLLATFIIGLILGGVGWEIAITSAFKYSLLLPKPYFEPTSIQGNLFIFLFRVLIPIQAALFAFALRNRLRR